MQLRKRRLWCAVAVAGAPEFTVKYGELLLFVEARWRHAYDVQNFFFDSATTVGHSLRAACDGCYEEYRKRTDNHYLVNVVYGSYVVYGSSVAFEPRVNTQNERVFYQDLHRQDFRPVEGLCGR